MRTESLWHYDADTMVMSLVSAKLIDASSTDTYSKTYTCDGADQNITVKTAPSLSLSHVCDTTPPTPISTDQIVRYKCTYKKNWSGACSLSIALDSVECEILQASNPNCTAGAWSQFGFLDIHTPSFTSSVPVCTSPCDTGANTCAACQDLAKVWMRTESDWDFNGNTLTLVGQKLIDGASGDLQQITYSCGVGHQYIKVKTAAVLGTSFACNSSPPPLSKSTANVRARCVYKRTISPDGCSINVAPFDKVYEVIDTPTTVWSKGSWSIDGYLTVFSPSVVHEYNTCFDPLLYPPSISCADGAYLADIFVYTDTTWSYNLTTHAKTQTAKTLVITGSAQPAIRYDDTCGTGVQIMHLHTATASGKSFSCDTTPPDPQMLTANVRGKMVYTATIRVSPACGIDVNAGVLSLEVYAGTTFTCSEVGWSVVAPIQNTYYSPTMPVVYPKCANPLDYAGSPNFSGCSNMGKIEAYTKMSRKTYWLINKDVNGCKTGITQGAGGMGISIVIGHNPTLSTVFECDNAFPPYKGQVASAIGVSSWKVSHTCDTTLVPPDMINANYPRFGDAKRDWVTGATQQFAVYVRCRYPGSCGTVADYIGPNCTQNTGTYSYYAARSSDGYPIICGAHTMTGTKIPLGSGGGIVCSGSTISIPMCTEEDAFYGTTCEGGCKGWYNAADVISYTLPDGLCNRGGFDITHYPTTKCTGGLVIPVGTPPPPQEPNAIGWYCPDQCHCPPPGQSCGNTPCSSPKDCP
jgi:hypothetical protein